MLQRSRSDHGFISTPPKPPEGEHDLEARVGLGRRERPVERARVVVKHALEDAIDVAHEQFGEWFARILQR